MVHVGRSVSGNQWQPARVVTQMVHSVTHVVWVSGINAHGAVQSVILGLTMMSVLSMHYLCSELATVNRIVEIVVIGVSSTMLVLSMLQVVVHAVLLLC